VAAEEVKAGLFGGCDVVADDIVGGVGVEAIGVEGLVEGAAEVDRFTIEEDILVGTVIPAASANVTEASVRFDVVRLTVIAVEGGSDVVEERGIGRPGTGMGDGNGESDSGFADTELEGLMN
jgi:hypothetical protein